MILSLKIFTFLKRYRAPQMEIICKSYTLKKLTYQLPPSGPTNLLAFHLVRLGFWMFRVLSFMLYVKKGFWSLIVNIFLRMSLVFASLLIDKLPPFNQVCFILLFYSFSIFHLLIEVKFQCIYVFLAITLCISLLYICILVCSIYKSGSLYVNKAPYLTRSSKGSPTKLTRKSKLCFNFSSESPKTLGRLFNTSKICFSDKPKLFKHHHFRSKNFFSTPNIERKAYANVLDPSLSPKSSSSFMLNFDG
jgi:hypothetical protein